MEKLQATVLIIEDNMSLAESLIDLLELHDYTAVHVRTGAAGLQQIEELQPDLVLLDIRLPDITGYEVYTRMQAADWGRDIKTLVITASESIEHIAKHIDLPEENILFKPNWSMADLIARFETELQSTQPLADQAVATHQTESPAPPQK